MFRIAGVLLVCIGIIALIGCSPSTQPSIVSTAPVAVSVVPPVTQEEAWEFGEKVTKAMMSKNVETLSTLIQMDDLVERSISGIGLSNADINAFRAGLADGGGTKEMLELWTEQLSGHACKPLKVGTHEGYPSVLVRLVGPEGGLNYLDFPLARSADGSVTAVDIYILAGGEKLVTVHGLPW